MAWVIYFFGSGDAFFAGLMLALGGILAAALRPTPGWIRLASLLGVLGLILVVASAVPQPIWLYSLWGIVLIAWLVAERRAIRPGLRNGLRATAAFASILLAALELPYQFCPTLDAHVRPVLTIFGDSVAAGMGESAEDTWVGRLERERRIPIRNHAGPGAKVASALRRAQEASLDDGIVLLEIGGNDLLGGTPAADFERDLDALLSHVSAPSRTVLMFELPLPPLRNEYGEIQRRLATKHNVRLIPRRVFIRVLTASDATSDSVHLTSTGHALMAQTVWDLIGSAFAETDRPVPGRQPAGD
jgi:acyl-CoA thioesterase I